MMRADTELRKGVLKRQSHIVRKLALPVRLRQLAQLGSNKKKVM